MKIKQIVITSVIIAILFFVGCGIYHIGLNNGKIETDLKIIDKSISIDEDLINLN